MTPARRLAVPLLVLPLALAACGGGGSGAASGGGGPNRSSGTVAAQGPADAQTATVAGTRKLTFSPSTVTARAGTVELTLSNSDGVPHDLQFSDASVGKDIPVTATGSSTGTYTFAKPGTYTFVCTLHPGMQGKVVVS